VFDVKPAGLTNGIISSSGWNLIGVSACCVKETPLKYMLHDEHAETWCKLPESSGNGHLMLIFFDSLEIQIKVKVYNLFYYFGTYPFPILHHLNTNFIENLSTIVAFKFLLGWL
jgi:hypothetical protein